MGYDQFHALLTAILLAGNLANAEQTGNYFEVSKLAKAAEEIMDKCGFTRRTSRVQVGGAQ